MKIVLEIVLVGFLAVTFGEAFYMVKSKASDEVDKCYDSFSAGKYKSCFDVTKAEACLKKIDPANDEDKEMLEGGIKYMQAERQACPGFKTMLACRADEVASCDSAFRFKKMQEDKTICNDTEEVLKCINKELKDFCTDEAIRNSTAFAEGIDKECKAGTIFGGECTDSAVGKCTEDILIKNRFTDKNGKTRYHCSAQEEAEAYKCLADKKLKCKDVWTQMGIDMMKSNVNLVCQVLKN